MALFSTITDNIGLTDTGSGTSSAKKAAGATRVGTEAGISALMDYIGPSMSALQLGANTAFSGYTYGLEEGGRFLSEGQAAATGRLEPLAQAGLGAIGNLQAGATPGGYAQNIESLRTGGALDPLIAENQRNLQAQLASQGLTRSGAGISQMSQIPTSTLMGIESQLYGRQGDIAGYGLPALMNQSQIDAQFAGQQAANTNLYAQNLGELSTGIGVQQTSLYQSLGKDIANLQVGQGTNEASAILAGQQAEAAERANLASLVGSAAGAAGASDIKLKENIVQIGSLGGLNVYKWDWNEEGMKVVNGQVPIGFIAQEVEDSHPHHVVDMGGYKGINYRDLLLELEVN